MCSRREKCSPSHRCFLLNGVVVHVLVRICFRTPLKERLCMRMLYSLVVRVEASARRHRLSKKEDDSGLFEPAATFPAGSPMSPPWAMSPPSLPLRRQADDRTKSLLEIDQTGVARDPLSGDTIPTDPGHFNSSGCFLGRAWRRDVSTLAGIHLSPFGIVAPTPSRREVRLPRSNRGHQDRAAHDQSVRYCSSC